MFCQAKYQVVWEKLLKSIPKNFRMCADKKSIPCLISNGTPALCALQWFERGSDSCSPLTLTFLRRRVLNLLMICGAKDAVISSLVVADGGGGGTHCRVEHIKKRREAVGRMDPYVVSKCQALVREVQESGPARYRASNVYESKGTTAADIRHPAMLR